MAPTGLISINTAPASIAGRADFPKIFISLFFIVSLQNLHSWKGKQSAKSSRLITEELRDGDAGTAQLRTTSQVALSQKRTGQASLSASLPLISQRSVFLLCLIDETDRNTRLWPECDRSSLSGDRRGWQWPGPASRRARRTRTYSDASWERAGRD